MSLEVVREVKEDLVRRGVALTGPCGAFEITKRVAKKLNAGLLSKPGGNNCNGYAVDIVCYADGHIYDILQDGGGLNNPTWQDAGMVDPGRFRVALTVDEVTPDQPPVEPPNDGGADIDLTTLPARLTAIETALAEVLAKLNSRAGEVVFPNYAGRLAGLTLVLRPSA